MPTYSKIPVLEPQILIYTFAVHPLHNPKLLFSGYQPLINHINRHVEGFQLKLVASRDYAAFERRLYAGDYEVALPNPLQTLRCLRAGYEVVGKMADDERFQGIIITRKDSNILFVEDLEDRPLSFPAPTALAATLMPKYFLKSRGLVVREDLIHYVGSQESAIMNVYLGKTDAAGTWPLPWESLLLRRPEIAESLKVQWRTEPLINNALVMRKNMPPAHRDAILRVLFTLQDSPEGRKILQNIQLSRFEPSSDKDYQRVADFLQDYEALFGEDSAGLQP